MINVSIIGATFTGNRGAEAMLTTVIAKLKKNNSDLHFQVFSYYPVLDRLLISDRKVTIHSATPTRLLAVILPLCLLYSLLRLLKLTSLLPHFPGSVKSLASSVVMIDLAGVSFIDGREKYLPYNILTLLPAFLLSIPVVKLAQAVGPFQNPLNRLAASSILPRCRQIFARGQDSFDNLRTLTGLKESQYQLSSDLVFLRPKSSSLSTENPVYLKELLSRLANQSHTHQTIGICPSSVLAHRGKNAKYLNFLLKTIKSLRHHGHPVIVFPNAALPRTKFRNNDLAVINLLKNSLPKRYYYDPRLEMIDHCLNADSIKMIIRECDLVITSRFHAMITSLTESIPTVVVGWSHKYQEVMREFGQEDLVIDYNSLHTSYLSMILHLSQNRQELLLRSQTIAKRLIDVRRLAKHQLTYLRQIL